MSQIANKYTLNAFDQKYFDRQLTHVMSRVREVKYAEEKARRLLPVNNEVGAGAESFVWHRYKAIGQANIISDYSTDFKKVDITAEEVSGTIKDIGNFYEYTNKEIKAAAQAKIPLVSKRAAAAPKAISQLENKIAFFGDAASGLPGLFTQVASLPTVSLLADGTGSAKTFASKTPDQIIRDLTVLSLNPYKITNGVEQADTMLISLDLWVSLTTKRVTDTGMTILQYFLANSPNIKNIEPMSELDKSGLGCKIMVYRRDPEVVELIIPDEFSQEPPQAVGLAQKIHCSQSIGGTVIYYPKAFSVTNDA